MGRMGLVLETWKDIKKSKFLPVYVLYGTESFLISETKQLLMKNLLNVEEIEFNLSTYDLEEVPIEVALEDAETLPFFGEKKLIFLHNPSFLIAEKSKAKVEHDLKRLEEYLQNPSPFTVLVFAGDYEKLDERKKLTKELKRMGALVHASKLNEREILQWIESRFGQNGAKIDERAKEKLLALIGDQFSMLATEIEKLILFANGEVITEEMVNTLVSRSLEQNVFDLVDKIVQRKISEALTIYHDLLKLNEEPIKILALISNQFRIIYQVKELSRRGYGQQQIAGIIKIHPYRVKLAINQTKWFSDEELIRIIDMLAECDYMAKTSTMSKNLIVELFLFKLHKSS